MSLTQITALEIKNLDYSLRHVLHSLAFTHLTNFATTLPLETSLIAFLNRHPSLESLILLRPRLSLQIHLGEQPQVCLPQLKILIGWTDIQIIVPGTSCLQHVTLRWGGLISVDSLIGVLSEYSADSLLALTCSHRTPWDSMLIETISRRLPNIESLRIEYRRNNDQAVDMVSPAYLIFLCYTSQLFNMSSRQFKFRQ
jgi:hypothetical protein